MTLLHVGAEDGSLAIIRRGEPSGTYGYQVVGSEAAIDDDDEPAAAPTHAIHATFEAALDELERYPWRELYPLHVAPDFGELVWSRVEELGSSERSRWMKLCRRPSCPSCRSAIAIVPILYGEPTKEAGRLAAIGELELGGCLVFDESSGWHCRACRASFGERLDV